MPVQIARRTINSILALLLLNLGVTVWLVFYVWTTLSSSVVLEVVLSPGHWRGADGNAIADEVRHRSFSRIGCQYPRPGIHQISRRFHIRCFVVGDKVVAAMTRQGAPGEFHSNVHRGGSTSVVKLSAKERKTAVKAAKAMGLVVAGVDLLRSERDPLIMEVNSSPGLEGIEKATELDVAGTIIDYIEQNAGQKKRRTIAEH